LKVLTLDSIPLITKKLANIDKDLAKILEIDGVPPLWDRAPGYAALVKIILEQQVSLTSAQAVYARLQNKYGVISVETILIEGEEGLRQIGITRQKSAYCLNLAKAIIEGNLNLLELESLDDAKVIEQLTSIKGIGPWTANVYLLMVLCRQDVWPVGDVALATAAGMVKGLSVRPTQPELTQMADSWRPYRSVAARMLWQHYLKNTGMKSSF
jgi:DNA-3-methyladenine glycosylase II